MILEKYRSMTRIPLLVLLLAFSGCATLPHAILQPTPPAGAQYEAEPGRDAATVAALRAAPPPAAPELGAGTDQSGDRRRLAAQGFVHIGTGRFAGSEGSAREDAIRQGRSVGADRILLYPNAVAEAEAGHAWLAMYYVRSQLPFGATFRDLRAQERATLAANGGVEIGAVIGGTPAARANLLAGDYVLKFNGRPFADRAAFQTLLKQHAGRSVTLTIVRNGETLERVIRLGAIQGAAER